MFCDLFSPYALGAQLHETALDIYDVNASGWKSGDAESAIPYSAFSHAAGCFVVNLRAAP